MIEIDYVADLEGAEYELYAPSLMDKKREKNYVLAIQKIKKETIMIFLL